MKIWKFLLSVVSVVFVSLGTLLFQPTVFCEITIPVTAKLLGWKAQAGTARLSAFGTLEIHELEAVDQRKSRIAMDSAKVEFDPLQLLIGRPEILRADFRFDMVDLELTPEAGKKKKASAFSIPFSLREASLDLVEGRFRTETGAWILKSVYASAEGWDGQTPREIRVQLGRLDWNGPEKQELATTTQATAKKSKNPSGENLWDLKLTTDVSTVVDLPPWNLVAPCRLVLEGIAEQNAAGDWEVDGLQANWTGVGGIRLGAKMSGTYAASGEWTAQLNLEPTDLQLAGIFLQPRGIQNIYGTMAGAVKLRGAPGKRLGLGIDLNGQMVQLVAAGGANWPAQPAAMGISSRGEWRDAEGSLKVESLAVNLGRVGQPADFQLSLDRPAMLQLNGRPSAQALEPASLQWAARGLELAAVGPILVDPTNLKFEGGKLSANGQATIEGEKVGLSGKAESRSLSATGPWVLGKLAMQSAALDFQGYVEKATKIHLDRAQIRAAWEGGAAEDLEISAKAEWDWAKSEGFVAGDLATGLTGLGQAWAGAKFWPSDGQAKAHLEFSGNFGQKGSGLFAVTLSGMRWPGETGPPWGAKLSSEVKAEQGTWTLPEVALQADRAGESLLDARISALWKTGQDTGRARVQLAKAESAFLVPLLKNFTPEWQWTEASGKGSFEFTRENRHDLVKADLQAAVTVETGTPQRPRPVDFSSVQGNLQASWPTGAQGELAVESLSLVAKHRDGTEAVRAFLDAPLFLKKKGAKEWEPAGTQASSGMAQFAGWPMGIVAPLIFPKANESSIAGTLSGFLRVQSDPQKRLLSAQLDLKSPDLSVQLPELRFPENQVELKANVELEEDGDWIVQKVTLASRQTGTDWLELSVEKAVQPGLALEGEADLGVLQNNVPAVAPYVSSGRLFLKAHVGEPKNGVRKLAFSSKAQGLTLSLPKIGAIPGLEADTQGILSWGVEGFAALEDLHLTAQSPSGDLRLGKVSFQKNGVLAWESAHVPSAWVELLLRPWIHPNRWLAGEILLEKGFWNPDEHQSSGFLGGQIQKARVTEDPALATVSLRFQGSWAYDNRIENFSIKDGEVAFVQSWNDEKAPVFFPAVQIPFLEAGPNSFRAKVDGGVIDLRGLLTQISAWKNSPSNSMASPQNPVMQISANLDEVILEKVQVGPLKMPSFRYGPDGIALDKSSVAVQGGLILASMSQIGGSSFPFQIHVVVDQFPLDAILGPMIQDALGPVGGIANLRFDGQAAGGKVDELKRSLSGRGTLSLSSAHLENLPGIRKALKRTGEVLGSSFIAGSEINGVEGPEGYPAHFQVAGTKIFTDDLRISGTALAAGMRGSLDWSSQALDFRVSLALTREAIQSSGQLQGVMTQLVGNNTGFFTTIPGSASIGGTLADPLVEMDVAKMLMEGGINLFFNAPVGILEGANGATGGLTTPVTTPIQGIFNLLKGN